MNYILKKITTPQLETLKNLINSTLYLDDNVKWRTKNSYEEELTVLPINNKTKTKGTQLAVEPTIKPNEDMVKLVNSFRPPKASSANVAQEGDDTKFPSVLGNLEAENKAILVGIDSYVLVKEYANNPIAFVTRLTTRV